MQKLQKYLEKLNHLTCDLSLFLNLNDFEDFVTLSSSVRLQSNWLNLGYLYNLSFANQDSEKALESYLRSCGGIVYINNREFFLNIDNTLECFKLNKFRTTLSDELINHLEFEIEQVKNNWAYNESKHFVYSIIPEMIKEKKNNESK